MKTKKDFENFLSTIPLERYRENYAGNKSVEEDLPKDIQILDFIYKKYWDEKNFIGFEEFILQVIQLIEEKLKLYNRKRNNYSQNADAAFPAFLDGWVARQYRTWASILTQIQFGYCAQEFYPNKKVIMNSELDSKGVDVRVVNLCDYGVKKVSKRKDIIKMKRQESEGVVPITYWVPQREVIKNPKTKKGIFRKPYLDFKKDERLDILDNGFIIFNENVLHE